MTRQEQQIEQLLPPEVVEAFKKYPIHSQDGIGTGQIVVCKFFLPASRYTFFVTEGEPIKNPTMDGDWEFFGYCLSPLGEDCDEWGYTTLQELTSVEYHVGIFHVERDRGFPLAERTISATLSALGL